MSREFKSNSMTEIIGAAMAVRTIGFISSVGFISVKRKTPKVLLKVVNDLLPLNRIKSDKIYTEIDTMPWIGSLAKSRSNDTR